MTNTWKKSSYKFRISYYYNCHEINPVIEIVSLIAFLRYFTIDINNFEIIILREIAHQEITI